MDPKWHPPPKKHPKGWDFKMKAILSNISKVRDVSENVAVRHILGTHYTSNIQDLSGLHSMSVLLQREFVDQRARILSRVVQLQTSLGPGGFPMDQLEMLHKVFCSLAGNTRSHATDGFLNLRGFTKLAKVYRITDPQITERLFLVYSVSIKSMGENLKHHDSGDSGITFQGTLQALKTIKEGIGVGPHSVQRRPYVECLFELINDKSSLDVGGSNIHRMELFNFMTQSQDGLQNKHDMDEVFEVNEMHRV